MIGNNTVLASVLSYALVMMTSAHAAKNIEECQKNNTEATAISQCLDKVIHSVDRELQTWVTLHSFNLAEKALMNGRDSAVNMFKRSQSNFVTYRENDCRWRYLIISPATGADLAYKKCYIILSQSRISTLSKINTTHA